MHLHRRKVRRIVTFTMHHFLTSLIAIHHRPRSAPIIHSHSPNDSIPMPMPMLMLMPLCCIQLIKPPTNLNVVNATTAKVHNIENGINYRRRLRLTRLHQRNLQASRMPKMHAAWFTPRLLLRSSVFQEKLQSA